MREVTPNYFIVGAHKCGTTFLAEHLRMHPEVFMTEPKEPQHFSREIRPWVSPYKNPELYQTLFRNVRHEKAIGEASTWYLYSEVAARAIHQANPEARIIIMLRNPVDFLHSLHNQLILGSQETVADFEEAIGLDYHRRRELGLDRSHLFACGFEYRKAARFGYQIRRYLDCFGRDRVHFVLLDDIKASPANAYADVLRFLGVDDTFKPTFQVTNANKKVRSQLLMDAVYFPSKIKSTIARALPLGLRRRAIDLVTGLATVETPRTPMPIELRRRLTSEYESEIHAVARLIDRDLSSWVSPAEPELQAR